MELADINLLDRDVFTAGVPHEWFTFLRREAPVYRHPEPDGPGFWVISRHEDVIAVGRDPAVFSSAAANGGVVGLEDPPARFRAARDQYANASGNLMLMMDPPAHTRYRKLVNRGFTPRMISLLEEHIRNFASGVIDKAIAQKDVDFVEVAADVPLQAIAELLGVPTEDRHKLFEWSNKMIGSEDPEFAAQAADTGGMSAQIDMFMYAAQLAEARRKEPRDDIITTLLNADIDGDELSVVDFNMFFLLLAVAGNETTRNAITHGMNAFLDNPDQFEQLVADRALSSTATEEILRWATPVLYFRRNVMEDTAVRGQPIKAGEKVSLWYISANRDEEVFEHPFRFDIRRDPNPHVAFGGGGPHFCLGANLARLEIRVFFEELAARARVERTGRAEPLRSNFVGGIKHLPVRLEAAS